MMNGDYDYDAIIIMMSMIIIMMKVMSKKIFISMKLLKILTYYSTVKDLKIMLIEDKCLLKLLHT